MRPCDVDALLRSLLPALTLSLGGSVAGCTSATPAAGSAGAPASGQATTAQSQGQDDSQPVDDEEDADEGGPQEGGDEALAAKLDLGPPEPLDRHPKEMNYPRCPTVTWCATADAAIKVAENDERTELGCPVSVTSDLPLAIDKEAKGTEKPESLMGDPVYSALFLRSRTGPVTNDAVETQKSRAAGEKDACCYSWTTPCPGGRPFLDANAQPVVAALRPGEAWTEAWSEGHFELAGTEEVKREAAKQWLADAAMEHASVASFARTTLELMALGAPAELLVQTQRAAIDEIEHAKTCLAIARACGASTLQPGPMKIEAPREADFARFAADTFVEGCIGETTAALAVQRAAAGCQSEALRAALNKIADDEAQHAALAWQTVAWALAQGGESVREALAQRAAQHVQSLANDEAGATELKPQHARALASLGRLDAQQLRKTQHDAWFGIVEPMLARL